MTDKQRIRLLMVTECFGGGVFAYLVQLCNDLCNDFEVYLAYATRAQTPANFKERINENVRLIEVDGFGDISPIGVARSIRQLRRIEAVIKPDVIHLHSSLAGAIGRIAFDQRKTPLVYTPHGYSFILLGEGPKSKGYRVVEKILAGRALTLNCCESEDEVARTLGGKSSFIETGLNVNALDKSLEGIEPTHFERFTVFSLGKAYVQKQPWLFNAIAQLVPEADFIWIGGGELENVLTAPNVTCTGWLPREKALSIAKGADAFILCSKGEAIAMSLLEAMYLKKLILVSDVMGNKSVIHDGVNGFVCNAPEEYALHILEAIHLGYPCDLPKQARNDIDIIYNTDNMCTRFSLLYKRLNESESNHKPKGISADIRYAIRRSDWLYRQCIRGVVVGNELSWRAIDHEGVFSKRLAAMRDSKCGGTCFIVGNGPSLTVEDLEGIKSVDSFGTNSIFRVFEKTDWRPTYYVTQDIYGGIEEEVNRLTMQYVFVGSYYWHKVRTTNSHALCYKSLRILNNEEVFANDHIETGVTEYETVTFSALQIALHMGYKRIYLIGIDHSYARELDDKGRFLKTESCSSHFYDDGGRPEIAANIKGMERAYKAAAKLAATRNACIYNATRGGKLEVFERADLDEVLASIESEGKRS